MKPLLFEKIKCLVVGHEPMEWRDVNNRNHPVLKLDNGAGATVDINVCLKCGTIYSDNLKKVDIKHF